MNGTIVTGVAVRTGIVDDDRDWSVIDGQRTIGQTLISTPHEGKTRKYFTNFDDLMHKTTREKRMGERERESTDRVMKRKFF